MLNVHNLSILLLVIQFIFLSAAASSFVVINVLLEVRSLRKTHSRAIEADIYDT